MPAYVEHEFPRGFILDEERLRKLAHLVSERLANTGAFQFHVYRGDAFTYTTDSVDEVLKEDNADWRRLTKLELRTVAPTDLALFLSFSSSGTRVEIEGTNRDAVFLLFSDLRAYLKEEVNTAPYIPKEIAETIGGIVGVGVMALFLLFANAHVASRHPPHKELLAAITAASDTAKLNFLLHKAQLESTSPVRWERRTELLWPPYPIAGRPRGMQALGQYIIVLQNPPDLLSEPA